MAAVVTRLGASHSPTEALRRFAGLPHVCLLQSAAPAHPLSRFSFLSADPVALVAGDAAEWPRIRDRLRQPLRAADPLRPDLPPFQGGWMGWFGYDLGSAFDDIDRHPVRPIRIPDVTLGLYDWVIAWDHERGDTCLISTGVDPSGTCDPDRARRRAGEVAQRWRGADDGSAPGSDAGVLRSSSSGARVHADFTPMEYAAAVQCVIDYVLAGDIFQANLAQRFTMPFHGDAIELHDALTRTAPAPMAAFLRHDDVVIVSASPERFLRLDGATRGVETRPIKGTRPRDADPRRDVTLAHELVDSEKDRAENVMIVDLLRNDLSRVCRPGTVRAPTLCALESFATVHHLVSTVTGVLRPECDALDLIAATFPGGSITGAPKLRAMEIIRELEPVARGVYSGAIGWIGLDGSMDTSIAIRTITIANHAASFHAGGGITAQSDPGGEYQETLDKARALQQAVAAAG